MKIGIVGHLGVVGGAYAYAFKKLGHEVRGHDIRTVPETSIVNLLPCDVIFICVPTPQAEDGSCDTNIVKEVINNLDWAGYPGVIAIKSTVAPGTTAKLRNKYPDREICFVPEFLRERHATHDATEGMDILVVGTYNDDTFKKIVEAHGKYPSNVIKMSPTEAELCKYYNNVFNALRVIFANDFYEVCQKLDANYSIIKNAIVKRPNMIDMYLDCNDSFRGFAGMCLPKDSSAFAKLAKDLGVPAKLFDVIVEDNKLYKATVPEGMRP